jgi:hypothetical protein
MDYNAVQSDRRQYSCDYNVTECGLGNIKICGILGPLGPLNPPYTQPTCPNWANVLFCLGLWAWAAHFFCNLGPTADVVGLPKLGCQSKTNIGPSWVFAC